MRIRSLLSTAVLAGGLVAVGSAPAVAAPQPAAAQVATCELTVTDLYYSIGMQTAFARLTGGCSGFIDIALQRADSPAGPFQDEPEALFDLQQAQDGTAATAYFTELSIRGVCRAKATAGKLVAVSTNVTNC